MRNSLQSRTAAIATVAFIGILSITRPSCAQNGVANSAVTVRFDYAAAQALVAAVQQQTLSEADVSRLLETRGVRAMIANQNFYTPPVDSGRFTSEIREFVGTHAGAGGLFNFGSIYRSRVVVNSLIAELKAHEAEIIHGMLAELKPYQPPTGPLTVTVYFVAGGSSDGFIVYGDKEPAFFVALDKASGDLDGVKHNMAHEIFHAMQKAAGRRVPAVAAIIDSPTALPPPERLLLTMLWEGTATYAADASKATGSGPYIVFWRGQNQRNTAPARITENFALFDSLLTDLRSGRRTWDDAYAAGLSGNSDQRLYYVGYEMARVIERYGSSQRIGELFQKPPATFFREYIDLCRVHPEITARFAAETESYISTLH